MSYLVSGLISTGGRIGSGCPFSVLGFSSRPLLLMMMRPWVVVVCEFVMIGFALGVCN